MRRRSGLVLYVSYRLPMRKRRRRRTSEQVREALARLDAETSGDVTWKFVGRIFPIAVGELAVLITLVVAVINASLRRKRGVRYLLTNRSTLTFAILTAVVETTRIIVVRQARGQLMAAYRRSGQ